MSATSSFIHGVDYPYVDCIVFVNLPYGLIDFVQASARGGRHNRPCFVIVLHDGTTETAKKPDYKLNYPMTSWTLSNTNCRRKLISQNMDGIEIKCSILPEAQACDICKPQSSFKTIIQDTIKLAKPSNLTIQQFMMVKGEVSRTSRNSTPTPKPPTINKELRMPSPTLDDSDFGIPDDVFQAIDMDAIIQSSKAVQSKGK